MVDFFLVRHGQTHWNAERRVQGHKDSSLTERGRTQAVEAAVQLAQRLDGRLPLIVSSDLWRAHATAQIIHEQLSELGDPLPPVRLERWLRERGLGLAEGRVWDDLFDDLPEAMQAYTKGTDPDAIPQSEPSASFEARLRQGFLRLADGAAAEHSAVVAVTHGGVIRAMQIWAGVQVEGRLPNASCWRFRFADGAAILRDD